MSAEGLKNTFLLISPQVAVVSGTYMPFYARVT